LLLKKVIQELAYFCHVNVITFGSTFLELCIAGGLLLEENYEII